MNKEKIKSDFSKRFGAECESIHYIGKPLIFLKGKGCILGCCVSVGCYLAVEKRDDDRLIAEFSHSDEFITVNASELEKNRSSDVFSILADVKQLGVEVGGARLLFSSNSKLETPKRTILLSAIGEFCRNVPGGMDIFRHFNDFEASMLEKNAKKDYLFLYNGGKVEYFPFQKERYKIVLSYVEDKRIKNFSAETGRMNDVSELLRCGDVRSFGKVLNFQTNELINRSGGRATKNLFDVAVGMEESLGNGALEEGGIFSIVENKDVDSFIRNLSLEYRRYYGKDPDFYVTDTETSGII